MHDLDCSCFLYHVTNLLAPFFRPSLGAYTRCVHGRLDRQD